MPRYTDRWGLSILGSGDSLQSDGYKFTDADRQLIDRLLTYATEQHRHTGIRGDDLTPGVAPGLTLSSTGGTLAAGTRYYYCFTIIDPYGNETAPSPVGFVDTPSTIETPGAPATNFVSGSGSLEPGGYSYVLSAYAGATTQETKATNSAFLNVPGVSPNNQVMLILPSLPYGADGFNVYRKSPSGMHFLWLAAVAAPDPLQIWTDDGTLDGDCDRSLPSVNRTGATNAIGVSFPGATPLLDDAWAWAVYRTTDSTNWSRSFLKLLTPMGATPTTPLSFTDPGLANDVGGPPAKVQIINAPPKVNLTDGAEVQGTLPPGRVIQPQTLTFIAPGPVYPRPGAHTWVCDYDLADIVGIRLWLAVDSVPAQRSIIVDVLGLRASKSDTDWTSLFAPDTALPRLDVNENTSAVFVPARQHFERGDALSVDIVQAGGGATPTDTDLTVSVLLYVKDGSETESYVWTDT